MPDIPERAALECLVNALIHRDSTIAGSEVHIDIYDDRMEIYSPGGMYDGSQVQNLNTDSVPSKRRNPVIADMFNRMNYMECRGSGFRKIKEDYRTAVNFRPELEPQFYSTSSTFIVTLYNLNYNVPLDELEIGEENLSIGEEKDEIAFLNSVKSLKVKQPTRENILKVKKQVGFLQPFGRLVVMTETGLSAATAGNIINILLNAGLIEPVAGFGKGKYQFIINRKK
ncbi:MAG: ATP-binding protein [Planctomycetia bacterium]|nr:ATP-binding protein [Planctomycetia bacterium]